MNYSNLLRIFAFGYSHTLMSKRYMNLMTDYAFKRIFGSEKNKNILIKLLNTLVDEKDQIVDVTFNDKESLPLVDNGKKMVYDIYCLTHDHRHIIVEMQKRLQPTFAERSLLYCTNLLVRQLISGRSYSVDPVYGIFIMDFHLVGHKPELIRRVGLEDIDRHEPFSDKLKMIYLDLKLMIRKSLQECKNPVEEWLYLIKNIENMNEKPKDYPMYDDLFDAADISHLAAEDVVSYGNSLRKMLDDQEGVNYYGRQQRDEGRAEGRAEGALEVLESLAKKFRSQGMSVQEIANLLDSDTKTIESLL